MNYGKKIHFQEAECSDLPYFHAGKKSTCFVYPGFIYSSDRSLRHGCLPWYRLLPGRDRRST